LKEIAGRGASVSALTAQGTHRYFVCVEDSD